MDELECLMGSIFLTVIVGAGLVIPILSVNGVFSLFLWVMLYRALRYGEIIKITKTPSGNNEESI